MKGADTDADSDAELFADTEEEEDSTASSLSSKSVTPGKPLTPSKRDDASGGITEKEFSCHCCYDVLVDPTTLTCGHSFCRHCLAQWWESSHKTECPECREKWEGFPRVNILLR